MAIAKTYRSDFVGQWQCPRGLSNFGMNLGQGIPPLGLEEFNFTRPYLDSKMAFVPCYGQRLYNDQVDLCLFHSYNHGEHPAAHGNYVYAKLHGARQVTHQDVVPLRNYIQERIHEVVGANNQWANGVALHPVYGQMQRAGYMQALLMNNVVGAGHEGRFVVNVHYNEIEFVNFPGPAMGPIGNPTNYQGLMAGVRGGNHCP